MVRELGIKVLCDVGIDYCEVEQGYVGYVYGELMLGQWVFYEFGMMGIFIVNVNNNCLIGFMVFYFGVQVICGGLVDCVLVLGFEKMQFGVLGGGVDDWELLLGRYVKVLVEIDEFGFLVVLWMFGVVGCEYMKKYGIIVEYFVKIGYKNYKYLVNNLYVQFQDEYILDDILVLKMIFDLLIKLQCFFIFDGLVVVVLVSEDYLVNYNFVGWVVEIVGQVMIIDFVFIFDGSVCNIIGYDMIV